MAERIITGSEAIQEALDQAMAADKHVIIIGEGVPDPKGIFGTTLGLAKKYGAGRVFDMPVSESAVTGVCIGAAIQGLRPVMTHQRVDFSLYALEQIINNAAKWHFMFGGQASVPLVIRMVIGRGWGQGAQHSQSLQALFAHIPGLKVVLPSRPHDAKGLLLSSIQDNNPVIFLEHRWIHGLRGHVPAGPYTIPLGKAARVREGRDVTLVSSSYMTIEALRAADVLAEFGISLEIIDLQTLAPLDENMIFQSVGRTGRLLAVDSGVLSFGAAAEIVARVTEKKWPALQAPPRRLALPDLPMPSAPALTKNLYPTYRTIVEEVFEMLGKSTAALKQYWHAQEEEAVPHDVPDPAFTGPF